MIRESTNDGDSSAAGGQDSPGTTHDGDLVRSPHPRFRLDRDFTVTGVNSTTGRVMSFILPGRSELEVKLHAQNMGLRAVTVKPVDATPERARGTIDVAAQPDSTAAPLVLVVDDHKDIRDVLTRMLTLEGYRAAGAAAGAEGLAFIQARMPALVITDFNMPEINGLELLSLIRADDRLRTIPVIVFSGEDVGPAVLRAGASVFLMKDTMDWHTLRHAVLRLAGPNTPAVKTAGVRGAQAFDGR